MFNILLVEDDESLAMGIEFTLQEEGYKVFRTGTLEEGKNIFEGEALDLIILDVNLPDGSGYSLCKYIRSKSEIPIMFLTALDEEINIVQGLEIGGDDYMTKPFGVREFLSRIKVLIRRQNKGFKKGNKLTSGSIMVDTASAIVTKSENKIVLTAKEYKLLLIFMNKPGVLLKRSEILKELTEGEEVFFDENTLSVYIRRIREKIEENDKKPEYIVTQRGLGYIWNKPVVKE